MYEDKRINCLDHGFVRLVDKMGDDSSIVQAARVSYGDGTETVQKDNELINYLLRHRHTTPFEMVEFKFHIKMPIMVMRQWIRHRTANVNEYSARYSIMKNEFYIPKAEDLAVQSTKNKQGREDVPLDPKQAEALLHIIQSCSDGAYENYEYMLNDPENPNYDPGRSSLARELARMNLPVNIYTECYWKIDLHNLLHFLGLRMDSHAQFEIRVFANAMFDIIKEYVPVACSAFLQYRLNAMTLSHKEILLVNHTMTNGSGFYADKHPGNWSAGEWKETIEKFKKLGITI